MNPKANTSAMIFRISHGFHFFPLACPLCNRYISIFLRQGYQLQFSIFLYILDCTRDQKFFCILKHVRYEIFYLTLLITEKALHSLCMPSCLSVCESQGDSEENAQCVPTSFDDNHFSQNSHNNPGTCQQVTVCVFC